MPLPPKYEPTPEEIHAQCQAIIKKRIETGDLHASDVDLKELRKGRVGIKICNLPMGYTAETCYDEGAEV